MTLEDFIILRRDELVAFFTARYGRYWRRPVARQTGEHPGTFYHWGTAPPRSLYRQIYRLEKWARTVGFTSPTDDQLQEKLRAYREFKQRAAEEIQKKRAERSSAGEEPNLQQMALKMAEGFRRMREASQENV